MAKRFQLVNTWNGGSGGIMIAYTTNSDLDERMAELACVEWIHRNHSYSFHEAITNQGYRFEVLGDESREYTSALEHEARKHFAADSIMSAHLVGHLPNGVQVVKVYHYGGKDSWVCIGRATEIRDTKPENITR